MNTDSFTRIDSDQDLSDFCDRISNSEFIGFDTEFVSENRYRPELCLLQVAADNEIGIIDTLAISNLDEFWDLLTEGEHITIAHAAREEFLFCYRACQKKPKRLMDVQLAAAFVGYDYPASYGNLVSQLLGEYVAKGETRTDWKRRPLSDKQIKYAVGDVVHLKRLSDKIDEALVASERTSWYQEEIETWMDDLICNEGQPQWPRISGASRLNRRSLGILQELWILRDSQARRQNRSPKRIIPDDLMIELAKRGSAKVSSFRSIRGFDSRVNKKICNEVADAIAAGLSIPDKELPAKLEKSKNVNLGLVGQFLQTVLNVVCRTKRIAPSLVGTSNELRNFAAWRLGMIPKKSRPALAKGWRSEIVGDAIEKAIEGRLAIRVSDPNADHPLTIESLD